MDNVSTLKARPEDVVVEDVEIPAGRNILQGTLTVPANPVGCVLFSHGSGSSRNSPRNQFVAGVLNDGGFATLLFDLLTPHEEAIDGVTARYRFDIGLLSRRLISALDWSQRSFASHFKIGLFGASTGAASALVAAAERPALVHAVISRGGRPDLAGPDLLRVFAPTLLLIGERDEVVIELNKKAYKQIPGEKRIVIIPGATHLFEEPGKLEEVAQEANRWFSFFLAGKKEKQDYLNSYQRAEG